MNNDTKIMMENIDVVKELKEDEMREEKKEIETKEQEESLLNRENFEQKLISLFFDVLLEAVKHNRVKRMKTYRDYLYLLQGNCLNCSIIDNARILKNYFYDLSLDKYNTNLAKKLDKLFEESLKLKSEVYKLHPNERVLTPNKNFSRLFKGKKRKKIMSYLHKFKPTHPNF